MSSYMKPRANRSDLKVVPHRPKPIAHENTHSGARRMSPSQANVWRHPNKKTMAELALAGKLSIGQIENAVMKGSLTLTAFRKAFWRLFNVHNPSPEAVQAYQDYGRYL